MSEKTQSTRAKGFAVGFIALLAAAVILLFAGQYIGEQRLKNVTPTDVTNTDVTNTDVTVTNATPVDWE